MNMKTTTTKRKRPTEAHPKAGKDQPALLELYRGALLDLYKATAEEDSKRLTEETERIERERESWNLIAETFHVAQTAVRELKTLRKLVVSQADTLHVQAAALQATEGGPARKKTPKEWLDECKLGTRVRTHEEQSHLMNIEYSTYYDLRAGRRVSDTVLIKAADYISKSNKCGPCTAFDLKIDNA